MSHLLYTYRQYSKFFERYRFFARSLFALYLIICLRFFWALITRVGWFSWFLFFLVSSFFVYIIIRLLAKRVDKNDKNWGLGFETEELVATKLVAMGPEYLVIHDIPKGKNLGNIDHIVVCPTGIFVIETKSNRNWMVDSRGGNRRLTDLANQFIKQAAANAAWTHNLILKKLGWDKFVQGLVVRPFNKDWWTNSGTNNNVWILDGDTVYNYIKNSTVCLNKDECEKINKLFCQTRRENLV